MDPPNPAFIHSRLRANSYDSVPQNQHEAGPLAHIPPSDPDYIDGLQRRASHRSSSSSMTAKDSTPTLPPLSFDSDSSSASSAIHTNLSTTSTMSSTTVTTVVPSDTKHGVFNHPNMNSSEPVLTSMQTAAPPTLGHRSVTSPVKRLAFATNLSIYDTFSPTAYDRRSEPATWSRLTPALAQKIKEELNSYKMEEMEVHSASRIQYVLPLSSTVLTYSPLYQHAIFCLKLCIAKTTDSDSPSFYSLSHSSLLISNTTYNENKPEQYHRLMVLHRIFPNPPPHPSSPRFRYKSTYQIPRYPSHIIAVDDTLFVYGEHASRLGSLHPIP